MKLPRGVKPQRLIAALKRIGFVEYKGRGSHLRLKHPDGRWTQVAVHPRPVPSGTLRKILDEAQLTVDQLKKLL